MLGTVHSERRGKHHYDDYEEGRNKLTSAFIKYIFDKIERVILRIYPEQVEYSHDSEHPENDHSVEEEEGKYSEQIDNAVKRKHEFSD